MVSFVLFSYDVSLWFAAKHPRMGRIGVSVINEQRSLYIRKSVSCKRMECGALRSRTAFLGRCSLLRHTARATFLNLDFANKTAYAYICVECGKIEWFEE